MIKEVMAAHVNKPYAGIFRGVKSDAAIQEEIDRIIEQLVRLGVPARIFSIQSINGICLITSRFIKKATIMLLFADDDLLEKILSIGIWKGFYIHHTSMDLKGFMNLVNCLWSADGYRESQSLTKEQRLLKKRLKKAAAANEKQLLSSRVKKVQDDFAVRKDELRRQLDNLPIWSRRRELPLPRVWTICRSLLLMLLLTPIIFPFQSNFLLRVPIVLVNLHSVPSVRD